MELQIKEKDPGIVPAAALLIDIGLDQVPFCDPIDFTHELHGILFELVQNRRPPLPDIVQNRIVIL